MRKTVRKVTTKVRAESIDALNIKPEKILTEKRFTIEIKRLLFLNFYLITGFIGNRDLRTYIPSILLRICGDR